MDDLTPYTRAELQASPEFPPRRGELCPHCGTRIPRFAELTEGDVARVLAWIDEGRMINAIDELRTATAAPLTFAHLWVAHRGRVLPPEGLDATPCPYCGKFLRSPDAKQCRHCKRDWHDPGNLTTLG